MVQQLVYQMEQEQKVGSQVPWIGSILKDWFWKSIFNEYFDYALSFKAMEQQLVLLINRVANHKVGTIWYEQELEVAYLILGATTQKFLSYTNGK